MANKKSAPVTNEAEEADFREKNQELIAERFERAEAAGTLTHGTVARLAQQRTGASPTITIRLAKSDLVRARTLAAKKGLRYQTYLKMLLHQALDSEERKVGRG